ASPLPHRLRRLLARAALQHSDPHRRRPPLLAGVTPPSRCGLTEIRGTHQPVHAENRQLLLAHPTVHETNQPRVVLVLGVLSLFLVHRALAEHFIHQQRHVATALTHHQQAAAIGMLRALAKQEARKIDHRHQVAADIGHAKQPRLGSGYRREHRHRKQLVDLVDTAHQRPLTDAETDAAPQSRRLELVLRIGSMRERKPLVAGQNLERGTVDGLIHVPLDSKSLMQASSSFSFTGLVMNARAPWRMPQTRSVSIDLVVIITTGTCCVFGSRVSVRVAWKPFIPGMMTSMMTRSGNSARTRSMPSSAVLTAAT